ncbi:hypothetical protein E2C01_086069 [Portunus trituberculatus]|uniref:Uncharacterized protein n=1 Tax=Portunus trituberculatus TaxID=210409 RepID=A0A5B7JAJ2_PORTR|nr:hypothetical protein [Portunus trituberculatus]
MAAGRIGCRIVWWAVISPSRPDRRVCPPATLTSHLHHFRKAPAEAIRVFKGDFFTILTTY